MGEGFKRPIYWNQYKVIPNKTYNANGYIRELLDSSYQGVKRLFVLTYNNANGSTPDSHKRYFSPRIKIKSYDIEIDGRNFYNQPINDSIKQYDELIIYYILEQSKKTILELSKWTTKVF